MVHCMTVQDANRTNQCGFGGVEAFTGFLFHPSAYDWHMKTDLRPAHCEKILAANHYGHLGCVDNGEPYVVPITYVYRDGFLYGFSQEGHKLEIMRKNPTICIQVERMESGLEWESIICWGNFEEVTDPKNIQDIKLLFAEQHGHIVLEEGEPPVSPLINDLHTQRSDAIKKSVIYRMKPYRMTGKSETH